MMEDDLWWKTTDDDDDDAADDTNTNFDGGGWLLVKFPFQRVFHTAAVCAAVRHFVVVFRLRHKNMNPKTYGKIKSNTNEVSKLSV